MNPIKKQIDAVLTQEMDRKDFLKNLAIGAIGVSGFGTALKLLADSKQKKVSVVEASAYGGSAYGGAQKSSS